MPRSLSRHHGPVRTEGNAGYGAVLRNREYVTLLVSQSLSVLGDQVAAIALALLVFDRTGSAFAAAATFAVGYATGILVGPFLSTLADRYPRRTVMVVSDAVRFVLVGALALQPPTPVLFALIGLVGAASPAFSSARSATLPDVLSYEDYSTGQGLVSNAAQASQVLGFALGGVMVATIGAGGALVVDAATFAASALAIRLLLQHRPAVGDAHAGLLRETLLGARTVQRSQELRYWLAWGMLIVGATAAPEGLAVALSRGEGGGPVAAGLLTAAGPLGFILGTFALIQVPAARRARLLPWATSLCFLPLILTALSPALAVVMLLWALAGAGGAIQVVANTGYVMASSPALRGRLFGVADTAMMAIQGLVLVVAGAAASRWGAATTIAVFGGLGLLTTGVLQLRGTAPVISSRAQELPKAVLTGTGGEQA